MSNTAASMDPQMAGTSREHSETASEGTDGQDMPEVRMHSQAAVEGPEGRQRVTMPGQPGIRRRTEDRTATAA